VWAGPETRFRVSPSILPGRAAAAVPMFALENVRASCALVGHGVAKCPGQDSTPAPMHEEIRPGPRTADGYP
jgi:hypothetical protein